MSQGLLLRNCTSLDHPFVQLAKRWVERLEANKDQVLGLVCKVTYRTWRLYMTACALEFELVTWGPTR